MKELIDMLHNVNIASSTAEKIARLWFYATIIEDFMILIGCVVVVYVLFKFFIYMENY